MKKRVIMVATRNLLQELEHNNQKRLKKALVELDLLTGDDFLKLMGAYVAHGQGADNFMSMGELIGQTRQIIPDNLKLLGSIFLKTLIKELRNLLCSKIKKENETFDGISTVTVTALAAVIVRSLGIDEPTANGLATLAIGVVLKSAKGTFCTMTDDEIERQISIL